MEGLSRCKMACMVPPVYQLSASIYLAQHYASGRILEDVNAFRINEADIGIDLKDTIYEGSGELWNKALHDPASTVDWTAFPPSIGLTVVTSGPSQSAGQQARGTAAE